MSYSKLDSLQKFKVLKRISIRKKNFLNLLKNQCHNHKVLIVGDRPGPSAPKNIDYHHTPFYSVKHCSGWLNILLEINKINENSLTWINAFDKDGKSSMINIHNFESIVVLGGNAEKWIKSVSDMPYVKTYHPQFWKRFKNSSPYPLIDILKDLLK